MVLLIMWLKNVKKDMVMAPVGPNALHLQHTRGSNEQGVSNGWFKTVEEPESVALI